MRLISSLLTLIFLPSCTLVGNMPAPHDRSINWETRYQQNTALSNWETEGALGISSPKEGVNASFLWQQRDPFYRIQFYGPMKSNGAIINGNAKFVRIQLPSGEHRFASTPEELVKQELGWQLPISHMHYWVRGLPVPNIKSYKTLDTFNHMVKLEQSGWTIRYLAYTSLLNLDLPRKILMTKDDLRVKIVIRRWDTEKPFPVSELFNERHNMLALKSIK